MNEMTAPLVLETLDEGVLTLTLGGGKAHALSLAMIEALSDALARAEANPQARVILLEGPGHIFCAGHDLKEIARHRHDEDRGEGYLRRLFARCSEMMQALVNQPQPVIAMVEGIATAGGLQLVASCDMAFAAPGATFCLPGAKNGGFCTTPSVAVGRAIGRRRVMEMVLSGLYYDADWALAAGLINRIVPAARLAEETRAFARALLVGHAPAMASGKRVLYRQLEMPLAQAYAEATEVMIDHFMDPSRPDNSGGRWG